MRHMCGFTPLEKSRSEQLTSRLSAERSQAGFTLLELLVVIGIIGLFAAIVLVSLTSARTSGKATRVLQDFQQLERAMLLFADDENIIEWWKDNSFTGTNDPTIQDIIETTNLSTFLSRAPSPSVGDDYRYHAPTGGGSYSCGGDPTRGVSLTLSNVPDNYFDIFDESIDSGDGPSCGKVNYVGTTVYYRLGASRGSY